MEPLNRAAIEKQCEDIANAETPREERLQQLVDVMAGLLVESHPDYYDNSEGRAQYVRLLIDTEDRFAKDPRIDDLAVLARFLAEDVKAVLDDVIQPLYFEALMSDSNPVVALFGAAEQNQPSDNASPTEPLPLFAIRRKRRPRDLTA